MRRRNILFMISVALVALIPVRAMDAPQSAPDFSGSWKPEGALPQAPPPAPPSAPPGAPAPTVPPPPQPPPQTRSLSIIQTPTELRIDRTVGSGERTAVYKLSYKLDGSESVNQMGPISGRTRASWEGSKLTLSTVRQIGDKVLGDGREVYSLEGDKLIVETTSNLPVGRISSRDVFVRDRPEK